MKKIYLIIWTLVLAAMFISCEKDEEAMLMTLEIANESYMASYTSADVACNITSEATIKHVYIHYSTMQDFVEYEEVEMQGEEGLYKVKLTNLQDNTTYYVRYAASNRFSSIIGEELGQFQTLAPSIPSIVFDTITTVWDTYAQIKLHIEFDGGAPIDEMGICWDTQAAPVVESHKLTTRESIAVLEINDLQPNTQYFARAYAKNKIGIAYSEEYEFTTYALPEIRTEDITDIQLTAAFLKGTLVFDGNDTATIKGFCWSTNDEPTLENNHIEIDTTSATYTCRLSNLKDETQYYVRAFAKNKIGVVYGESKSFTTQSAVSPTVSTNEVTEVEYHSATIAATVISDGGADVTERGICYSTTKNPTTESTKIASGNGTGSFTINLSNLQDSTTYYVRAYAINKKGIAYGEQVTFMTKGYKLPTITTTNPTNVEYTSATVGGNISSDGGAEVTERGICYSTIENPTTESTKIASGNGTGSFTINLSNLQDSTTYYVRAYAINKKGIAYGEQVTFLTKGYVLPTVTTSSATNIAYTTATIGGNVTSDGGANVTERGVVYSTNQNPTTSNSKVTSGNGVGSFTCNLTNLQENTKYYVRAYAINKKGTSYGPQASFTTKAYTLPTVTTSSATNISYTSATIGGNVTSDGGMSVTERGVVYSTSANPTTANSKVTSGSGMGAFTCNMTGLQPNTTYYVRVYAVNEKGTSYGEQKSFTTKVYTLPTVTTSDAINITYTSATIGGNVTSDGGMSVTERGVVYSTSANPTTANSKVTSGSGMGAFTCNMTGLQPNTTYYVRAYAINEKGTAYGEQVSFMTKNTSGLGMFSISSSKQVTFSKGNLQYHPANNQWRFAPSQWNYIGNANSNISSTYNAWIDLFGWSANTSANFGVSASTDYDDYSGSFLDWGMNNIGNDAPNTWRTLSSYEWNYILYSRSNASALKGVAQVNGINGLILLPDNWKCPTDITFKSGFYKPGLGQSSGAQNYAIYQTFNADQWSKMEKEGAVFLPAAGNRNGSSIVNLQNHGFYWSATTDEESGYVYYLHFESEEASVPLLWRRTGYSVRLVKDL